MRSRTGTFTASVAGGMEDELVKLVVASVRPHVHARTDSFMKF